MNFLKKLFSKKQIGAQEDTPVGSNIPVPKEGEELRVQRRASDPGNPIYYIVKKKV